MGAVRVRWSTLAKWVGAGLAALLAAQALPPLLRPPAPPPLAADVGLPRVRAAEPATPAALAARVSPARALPARHRPDRHGRRRPTGRERRTEPEAHAVGEDQVIIAPAVEPATPPPPPAVTPAPPPAPPPPPADGSVEFMPH
jgi:hypothetical protein